MNWFYIIYGKGLRKNIEIKYLIATNINEWFIFDATMFDRLLHKTKTL